MDSRITLRSIRATGFLGLQDLVLPGGQNTPAIGQPVQPKIFHFTEIRKRRIHRRNPALGKRGVSRSSRTRAGRRWTRMASARTALQGGRPWARTPRTRPVPSAYGKIVWSW